MSLELWADELEAAQLAAFIGYFASGAQGKLIGLMEIGLWLPMKDQDIPQYRKPYLGLKIIDWSGHLVGAQGGAVGCTVHDVVTRIDIQHSHQAQGTAQQRVRGILAHLTLAMCQFRVANPFSVNTANVKTIEMTPGRCAPSFVKEPDDESDLFRVEAEAEFTTRVRVGRVIA